MTTRGEQHGSAKLTADQVHEIRRLYRHYKRPQTELAKAFGISQSLVSWIVRGQGWKHLLGDGR